LALDDWDARAGIGIASLAPEVIFAEDEAVAPDGAWISQSRLSQALDPAGHLHAAPDLVIEVLSPGAANKRRNREARLDLYSRRGVEEYWIVDWRHQQTARGTGPGRRGAPPGLSNERPSESHTNAPHLW
jgi:Uma2 family endonuclease